MKARWYHPWRRAGDKAKKIVDLALAELSVADPKVRKADLQEAHERTVEALVSDVMHQNLFAKRAIVVSQVMRRVPKQYRSDTVGDRIYGIIDVLSSPAVGLLKKTPGSRADKQSVEVTASPRLRELMADLELTYADFWEDYPELIVLKGTVNEEEDELRDSFWEAPSRYVEYTDTETIQAMRQEVRDINGALDDYRIYSNDGGIDINSRRTRRIFTNRTIDSGGRLFGGFWLPMKKKHRNCLRVEGQRLVELDYGSMQATILYALADLPLPNSDPYEVEGLPRELAKRLFGTLTFDTGHRKSWPKGMIKKGTKHPGRVEPYVTALFLNNRPIKDMLSTRNPATGLAWGHTVQRIESDIMVAVLLELKRLGIPALPIHDAILVPETFVSKARKVMIDVFHAHPRLNQKYPKVDTNRY